VDEPSVSRSRQGSASPEDIASQVEATQALAVVRAAQGRDAEAEELFQATIALARASDFPILEVEPLERIAGFLRKRGREVDAANYEARLEEQTPPHSTARIA
jgi:hypothetical protein